MVTLAAHDARNSGGDVEHGVVLDIEFLPSVHVVVLIATEHGEGADAGALLDWSHRR